MIQSVPLVEVNNLKKYFKYKRGIFMKAGDIKAVDDVSFEIYKGETLGLVGESGSGKTTVGRTLLRLYEPTSGFISFDGIDLISLNANEVRKMRRRMQMIFQDPYASLNPRKTVNFIVGEPLIVQGILNGRERYEKVQELLEMVGLNPNYITRYPHEFSGGQRQRLGIARALALNPDFVICDEPISALDVSIQAQVVNLLQELQDKLNLTYLFIAHDLSMIYHISDRVAVMYLGKIVEIATRNEIFGNPQHPYTNSLISAVPLPNPKAKLTRKRIILEGDIPSPANPPSGCNFSTRCPKVMDKCIHEKPLLREVAPDHNVSCFLFE